MVTFDISWILPSYGTTHARFYNRSAEIVPASVFASKDQPLGSQCNKVIIARLLSITSPKNGQFGGYNIYAGNKTNNQGTPRRSRLLVTVPKYALLLTFADYFDPPNCIAIFISAKYHFQVLFGKDISNAARVKVGDMFAIKDPEVGANTLGESIHVLKNPAHIVGIVDQGWQTIPIRKSTEANHQVFFDATGKQVKVMEPELLVGNGDFPNCKGNTCDRQNKCNGCFGKASTTRPIVLRCNVHVMECTEYNDVTQRADFLRFTSLAFSNFFFRDLDGMSRRHPEEINSLYELIHKKVQQMVEYVNANGGWRVVGWHRRGVIQDTETGEATLSEQSEGHLTLLVPVDIGVLTNPDFVKLQIPTPTDCLTPPILHTLTTTCPTSTRSTSSTAENSPSAANPTNTEELSIATPNNAVDDSSPPSNNNRAHSGPPSPSSFSSSSQESVTATSFLQSTARPPSQIMLDDLFKDGK